MKIFKPFLILLGFGLFVFMVYKWWNNRYLLELGDKKVYELKIGEPLTIKLFANGSTGYQNCWINKEKSHAVELIDRKYRSSLNERLGYIGAGGFVYWTFTSKTEGIDTLKITNCPTGPMRKRCEDFKEDSIKADIQIIIKVK